MKFLIFFLSMGIGLVSIIYSKWLVDSIGRFPFFEEKLGSGGTYSFWKLLGVLFIIFGFYYLFGGLG
ncbi:MAG: hypothetical protein M1324_00225 [Patescibacteria group bacterium]|nr:hypothetical protein [Patescibacteria group bacterium]